MRSISSEQLEKWGLRHIQGPEKASAQQISVPEAPEPGSLVFLKAGSQIKNWDPVAILVLDSTLKASELNIPPRVSVLSTDQFRKHMGQALAVFDTKSEALPEGISPKAHISESAVVDKTASIGPGVVIGTGARIQAGARIAANAVIEAFAVVGQKSIIHSNVVIGRSCVVGDHCEIHANTTVGSDGFGYIPQKSEAPVKIPQIGRVILGDFVEIGANCAIDRGAIADTKIGRGTKIDNLCHIAHNCHIGKNCLITAGFMMAGSSHIGDRFSCGGNVAIADHIHITNDVSLGGRSTVTKDITVPGAYTGYPLQPLQEGLKTLASLRELPRLRQLVSEIRRHLNLNNESPRS